MNGLKYIRIRCNLSLNDLAEAIGVSRQALSSWENEKKDIPVQRQEQLSSFFGIDKEYFGEITEKEKQYLLEKAMFRYEEDGRETYRYKPKEGKDAFKRIFFLNDDEVSLDERFVEAQKKKKKVLEDIEDIIKWSDNAGSIQSQIGCINRGCQVYGMITSLMQEMRDTDVHFRMPFFYELNNVWKAMLVAYDLLDESEIGIKEDIYDVSCPDDGTWIFELAKQIKEHWENTKSLYRTHYEEVDKFLAKEMQNEKNENLSVEEQIVRAEERNRQFMRDGVPKARLMGATKGDKA